MVVKKLCIPEMGQQVREIPSPPYTASVCRMQVALSEFSKSKLKLLAHEAKKPRSNGVDRSIILPDREMERLRGMQQRNREIFLRQLKVVSQPSSSAQVQCRSAHLSRPSVIFAWRRFACELFTFGVWDVSLT